MRRAGAAEHTRESTVVEQPSGAVAPHGPVRRGNPDEEKHRRAERTHWRTANVTGIATAGAAVIAGVFAAGAYFAADRQASIGQDALFVTDRPWIKVEKVSVAKFFIHEGSVVGSALVRVKNFGQSPAINLFINLEAGSIDYGFGHFGLETTTAICKSAREKREAPTLQVVFPDESKPGGGNSDDGDEVPVLLVVSNEEMARAKKAHLDDAFEREKSLLGVEEAAKRRREAEAAPIKTAFTLAGCVTYFSYRGLIGQTGFVVHLYRRVHIPGFDFTDDRGSFDMGQTGDVPADETNAVAESLGGIYIR